MTSSHSQPTDAPTALRAPQRHRIKQALHNAPRAPQHQHVAGYFFMLRSADSIVCQINAGTGPVVFARSMQSLRVAKAALVFGQGLRLDVIQEIGRASCRERVLMPV